MSDNFSQYINFIGKGKRAGKTFSTDIAQDAFLALLNGDASDLQIGAFLMLLRMREETPEELAGFLQATRKTLPDQIQEVTDVDIDLSCYAGKRRHLPWLVLASITLAQQGYKVFMHGAQEMQSNRYYLDDVWRGFNWDTASSPEQAQRYLDSKGFCYMNLSQIHPSLYKLLRLRKDFGLRSCVNTLARMLNPTRAKVSLHGVYHRHFDHTHARVAQLLNEATVGCFIGDAGEVEVNPERKFDLHFFNGETIKISSFPALLDKWQMKPQELNHIILEQVWRGDKINTYGEHAVIGTIAVILHLLERKDVSESLDKAKSMWCNRDKIWPDLISV